MKRSEAMSIVAEHKSKFNDIMDALCTVSFDKHVLSDVVIQDIRLAKVTGMNNAPSKRDGKTPALLEIQTNCGSLFFVIEDTTIAAIHKGIRFIVGDMHIDLRKQ